MDFTLSQIPNKPRIHRAESQLAGFGALTRTGHRIQDPSDFRSGVVRIGNQTRSVRYLSSSFRIRATALHDFGGATALPHNGVVNGFSRDAIPYNGGLSLVGNTDTVYLACRYTC